MSDPILAGYEPVVLEIYERTDKPHSHTILPNDIRINGHKLLATEDEPVVIKNLTVNGQELLQVTITLLARKVTFDTAPKEATPGE